LLNWQSDIGLDAVYARLVPALCGQYDAGVLLNIADGAQRVRNRDELRRPGLVLLHRLIKLRVYGLDFISLLLSGIPVDAIPNGSSQVISLKLVRALIAVISDAFLRTSIIELHEIFFFLILGNILLKILLLILDHNFVVIVVILRILTQNVVIVLIFVLLILLLLLEFPLQHFGVEQVGLILEQIENDVLPVCLAVAS
jgi:hypothetical protein